MFYFLIYLSWNRTWSAYTIYEAINVGKTWYITAIKFKIKTLFFAGLLLKLSFCNASSLPQLFNNNYEMLISYLHYEISITANTWNALEVLTPLIPIVLHEPVILMLVITFGLLTECVLLDDT